MRQYKTYLFDFDYTLVDSSNGIVMCFRHVLDKHGYKNVDDRAIKRTIGMTLDDAFALLTGGVWSGSFGFLSERICSES